MAGIETFTELGAVSYIFSEFCSLFKINNFLDYPAVENSVIACLLKATEIKNENPSNARVDLYAAVLQSEDILQHHLAGVLFFEIYLTQKKSNGVCESLGRISNIIREGVRSRMGLLMLETNLRLHFLYPLEKSWTWFEYIRKT